jgi:hypothetical protein
MSKIISKLGKFNLSKFNYKSEAMITLFLIRNLHERGVRYMVDYYFKLLHENPKADKFEVLQNAHKMVNIQYNDNEYSSTNHMVTHSQNGNNVTRKQLNANIAKTKAGVYGEYDSMSVLWRG